MRILATSSVASRRAFLAVAALALAACASTTMRDSWFDPAQKKARPIADLKAALTSGEIAAQPNPASDVKPFDPAPSSWSAASPAQQRAIIDSYRLAYQGTTTVNWCPKLGTALANEKSIKAAADAAKKRC